MRKLSFQKIDNSRKIKQIEIQNNFENPNIPDEYLESFLKKYLY